MPISQELIDEYSADRVNEQNNKPKDRFQELTDRAALVQQEIAVRPTATEAFKSFLSRMANAPSNADRFLSPQGIMSTVGTATLPLKMAEAYMANPMLAQQAGNFNPINAYKEAFKGLSGQKMGEISDVFRGSMIPGLSNKWTAEGAGLGLSILIPIAVWRRANQAFGTIAKMSDKTILRGGEYLVKGADEGVATVGKGVEAAYEPFNAIKISPDDASGVIDDIAKLPRVVSERMEVILGTSVDDLLTNPTIQNIRKIKQALGRVTANSFGKEEYGVADKIIDDTVQDVYGAIAKKITKTVEGVAGKEAAQSLKTADTAFSEVDKAAQFIRRSVVDRTLKKPTKGKIAAEKLIREGDVTFRTAANTIRSSGKLARKNVDIALKALKAYNSHIGKLKIGKALLRTVLLGGIAGAVAGKVSRKLPFMQEEEGFYPNQ